MFYNECLKLLRYGHFCTQNWQFLMNFQYKIDHNSKTKNRKNLKYDFSFDSTLWASFMKIGQLLREGVICISLVGKNPAIIMEIIVILWLFTNN